MKLSDNQFNTIRNVANNGSLSRWVIVKEYLPMSTNQSHIDTIIKNFEIPKAARILPGDDIRIENYRGSKIVDLSSTLTFPTPEWSEYLFDFFYKETISGISDWFKTSQNGPCEYRQGLRPEAFPFCLEPAAAELEPSGADAVASP